MEMVNRRFLFFYAPNIAQTYNVEHTTNNLLLKLKCH